MFRMKHHPSSVVQNKMKLYIKGYYKYIKRNDKYMKGFDKYINAYLTIRPRATGQ